MTMKEWIKSEGGGLVLAAKLGCPKSVIYSWSSAKSNRTPISWQISLFKEVLELRKENEVLKSLVKGAK